MRRYFFIFLFLIYLLISNASAYNWPLVDFNTQHRITATLGEYRSTGSADHFHTRVDIGAPDGTPVYAIEPEF